MTEFTHEGVLTNGSHHIMAIDKTFYAGDIVPLAEADVKAFANKFEHVVETGLKAATEKAAAAKSKAGAKPKTGAKK